MGKWEVVEGAAPPGAVQRTWQGGTIAPVQTVADIPPLADNSLTVPRGLTAGAGLPLSQKRWFGGIKVQAVGSGSASAQLWKEEAEENNDFQTPDDLESPTVIAICHQGGIIEL